MTRRLLAGIMAVTLLVLALAEVPMAILYAKRQRDAFSADLLRDALELSKRYQFEFDARMPPSASIAARHAEADHTRVVLVDQHGVSLVDTGGSVRQDFSNRPEVKSALGGASVSGSRSSSSLGADLVYAAVPILGAKTPVAALRLTTDSSRVDRLVHRFWLSLIGVMLIALAMAAVVGAAVSRWLTRPITLLDRAARRMATGDLRARAVIDRGPPELVELANTLDQMAGRLESLIAEQRAFVADASHQLRTPLTGMRLRLENLQSRIEHGESLDTSDVEAAVDEVARLARLVGDLLQLARADSAAGVQEVDLDLVARERVETWQAMAEAAGIDVVLAGVSNNSKALAVPGAVEQVLDNAIDNAMRVSESGAVIEVQFAGLLGNGQVAVRIVDHAGGLSDVEKGRAFQRFWRGTSDSEGTGLGLPIARALALASGGDLVLLDTPGGGLTVELRLPTAGATTS
jgi:signal transduction histidine kinase